MGFLWTGIRFESCIMEFEDGVWVGDLGRRNNK
jgi:hypothetical protein